MNQSATLKVGGQIVELYPDERIELVLQSRNYGDINKVYADYSQPFTIPATNQNNKILRHWYEQGNTTGINAHNGIIATLSIAGLPSERLGMIELMSVAIANGSPKTYSVVFYGLTRNIATEIGEKRLADVDWSAFDHACTYTNIRNSWAGTLLSGKVLYPVVDYGTGYLETSGSLLSQKNISQTSGAVKLDNLRPSFLLRDMLVKCFASVGVTVGGAWTTDARLNNLYCLPMEKAGIYKTAVKGEVWAAFNDTPVTITGTGAGTFTKVTGFNYVSYLNAGSVNLPAQLYTVPQSGAYEIKTLLITQIATLPDTATPHLIVNGSSFAVGATSTLAVGVNFIEQKFNVTLSAGDEVWIGIKTTAANFTLESGSNFGVVKAPAATYVDMDVRELMPDIKIKDFIQSCVDTFNLVFTPVSDAAINIDFMQGYYSDNNIADITPHVKTEAYEFEKIEIYQEVNFEHDQKEDLANTEFLNAAARKYGSVRYFPDSDFASGTFNIKTAFQVLVPDVVQVYNNAGVIISNTNKEVLKACDATNKPVQIPLAIFYYCGLKSADTWYMHDSHLSSFWTPEPQFTWPVCRNYSTRPSGDNTLSLAFGFEGVLDDVNEDAPTRNLLQEYWREFLNNTYNPLTRRLTIEARLPQQLLYNIKLNTLLQVNGQVYAIEKMTYESLSDNVKFQLVSWRVADSAKRYYIRGNIITIDDRRREDDGGLSRYGGDDIFVTLLGGLEVLTPPAVTDSRDLVQQVTDLQDTVNSISIDGGDKHYTHVQEEAADIWYITHNLGKYGAVQVITSANQIVIGDVSHTNVNQCVITFRAGFAGKATIN